MSDELFQTEETLSPREKWARENSVTCGLRNLQGDGYAEDWPAEYKAVSANCRASWEVAPTRDEALAKLAQSLHENHGIKPWNVK